MINRRRILNECQRPWFLSLILSLIFFGVSGYMYGWDDQHLEIPLLKNLINPELYQGDYYVESLKANFTSYFYPILARIITVDQIPAVYFLLYIVSRYFLFYWMFKIWHHISRSLYKAFVCVLVFILMVRVDEFLYRTFSHQEFGLAIIFAGIYYFFKNRFILAALLLGLAANIHALYAFFPMLFLGFYLLVFIRKHGWKTLVYASGTFLLAALPFFVWAFSNRLFPEGGHRADVTGWLPMYITSCPQNFFFPAHPTLPWKALTSQWALFYHQTQSYLFILSLIVLNVFYSKTFRKNGQAVCFTACAFGLMVVCFIFTYLYPNKFVLDLNLCRNTQFLIFLLMGFTTLLIIRTVEKGSPLTGLIFALLFTFTKHSNPIATSAMVLAMLTLSLFKTQRITRKSIRYGLTGLLLAAMVPFLYIIVHHYDVVQYRFFVRLNLLIIFVLLLLNYFAKIKVAPETYRRINTKLFILIPVAIFFVQYGGYHYSRWQIHHRSEGFWRMQRNWEDMQRYVKTNTPVDSMLLVPYNMEMGGFRIQSERKIICSYRDCGIIGFDFDAAREWMRRVKDIEAYKVSLTASPKEAIQNAILKYNVDYIVFLRFISPREDSPLMERVYTNTDFALFKVHNIPALDHMRQSK